MLRSFTYAKKDVQEEIDSEKGRGIGLQGQGRLARQS